MKKLTFIHICFSLTAICLVNTAFAQEKDALVLNHAKASADVYKEFINLSPTTAANTLAKEDVSNRTQRSFNKLFQNGHPSWSAVEKNFLATFEVDGRNARALFTKSGYNLYTIIRGKEMNLPAEVRSAIKSQYYDFAIGTVNEVRVAGNTAWFVNLQSDKELIVVRVIDTTVDKVTHYALGK